MENFTKKESMKLKREQMGSNLSVKGMLLIFAMLFFFAQSSKAQIAAWDFTGETALATSTAEIYTTWMLRIC